MLETIVDLAVRLNIDTFELGSLVLFVALFFIVAQVFGAFRKTEVFRQYESYFRLLDDVIYGAIMAAQGDALDLAPFERRADERAEEERDSRRRSLSDAKKRFVHLTDWGRKPLAFPFKQER